MGNFKKYIGRPYEEFNCFDLVRDFYSDFFDINLKNYWEQERGPDINEAEHLITSNKGDFEQVQVPLFGDIIVIRLYGLECHVGVYIGQKKFLHSVRVTGSCIESLDKYKRLISGYYRHRETNVTP